MTRRLSYSLDFYNYIFIIILNMFLFALYFLEIVNWIQNLIRINSLAKGIEHI